MPKLTLDLKAEGKAELALLRSSKVLTFDTAILKKCTLEPMLERQAKLFCQLRVDPESNLGALGKMRTQKACQFSFVGQGQKEKDEKQGELGV